jgi:hypothetical protein
VDTAGHLRKRSEHTLLSLDYFADFKSVMLVMGRKFPTHSKNEIQLIISVFFSMKYFIFIFIFFNLKFFQLFKMQDLVFHAVPNIKKKTLCIANSHFMMLINVCRSSVLHNGSNSFVLQEII